MDVNHIHRFYLPKIAQRFAIARIEENALAKRRKSSFAYGLALQRSGSLWCMMRAAHVA
jgi:hypothetical protein